MIAQVPYGSKYFEIKWIKLRLNLMVNQTEHWIWIETLLTEANRTGPDRTMDSIPVASIKILFINSRMDVPSDEHDCWDCSVGLAHAPSCKSKESNQTSEPLFSKQDSVLIRPPRLPFLFRGKGKIIVWKIFYLWCDIWDAGTTGQRSASRATWFINRTELPFGSFDFSSDLKTVLFLGMWPSRAWERSEFRPIQVLLVRFEVFQYLCFKRDQHIHFDRRWLGGPTRSGFVALILASWDRWIEYRAHV